MKSRILTLETLARRGACLDSRDTFKKLFGDSVEVSVERFSQPDVIAARFDYDWAADMLLTERIRSVYYEDFRARRRALVDERGVGWYTSLPREEREKLEAAVWSEYYVKDGEELAASEATPAEEITNGDR